MGNTLSNNKDYEVTNAQKWWFSLLSGVLYALITSSYTFSVTNSIFRTGFNGQGMTFYSVLLHAIVFALLIRLILW